MKKYQPSGQDGDITGEVGFPTIKASRIVDNPIQYSIEPA